MFGYILFFWLLVTGLIFFRYRHVITSIWNEPVFRFPILIIESDDWGPGEPVQVEALENIIRILKKYSDKQGRSPVMTLGLTLAIADGERIKASDFQQYYRKTLDSPEFENILKIIKQGKSSGVFYIQLHGMEHYWPPALMQTQDKDPAIRDWLVSNNKTEDLPSYLQSRWSNGSLLPSSKIEEHEIKSQVKEECDFFNSLFGHVPMIVVPPTFDWNPSVEQAWSNQGVQIVITPGVKFEGRDKAGQLISTGDIVFNGQQSNTGLTYLVRDDYFEPVRGHKAEEVKQRISVKSRLARPVLLEMHRYNYYKHTLQESLSELDRMISSVCVHFPQIRFMTTEELVRIIKSRNNNYIMDKLAPRIGYWSKRMMLVPGLQKWMKLSGAILILKLFAILLLPKIEKRI